ncbi:rRNA maturation endonuclease Nob1 [Rhizobium sp. BK602]|nr:rRNA maturation endonuclease Nob1 [Rhizobium sp. BK602]
MFETSGNRWVETLETIVGISLFVRLAPAIVRPYKINIACRQCGLQGHDTDGAHCKACGHLLNIPDFDD